MVGAMQHDRGAPWRRRRRLAWCLQILSVLSCLLPGLSGADRRTAGEYELKAVFLFNFASFVDWPDSALGAPGAPFVIGVLGDDPFGAVLDEVVRDEQVRGRRLVVRRLTATEAADDCQILFISRSEEERLEEVLAQVRGRPTLTVGDLPGFAEAGGMVGFSTGEGRLRLTINADAVNAARLTVRAQLLQLARVVHAPPTEERR